MAVSNRVNAGCFAVLGGPFIDVRVDEFVDAETHEHLGYWCTMSLWLAKTNAAGIIQLPVQMVEAKSWDVSARKAITLLADPADRLPRLTPGSDDYDPELDLFHDRDEAFAVGVRAAQQIAEDFNRW